MTAYYNEIDEFAAEWLRNLIKGGHIADGVVDTRSIVAVEPADLRDFDQCHFFAGIGGWSLALRLAGWPDDRPVWTGSCPCQPFSAAGKRGGTDDERHLWPHQFRLLSECRPDVWFGEQVASKDGLHWLDLVLADLEGAGYAAGAVDLCAAGLGAPHIRQRLWIVGERMADADSEDRGWWEIQRPGQGDGESIGTPRERSAGLRADGRLGDGVGAGLEGHAGDGDRTGRRPVEAGSVAETGEPCGLADAEHDQQWQGRGSRSEDPQGHEPRTEPGGRGDAGWVGNATDEPRERFTGSVSGAKAQVDSQGQFDGRGALGPQHASAGSGERPGPVNGQWRDADWLHCRDGKWRPVEPGTFPLAHGVPARVGKLRAYGNAIVPQVAAEVIAAWMECRP